MIDAYRDAGGRGPLHLQVHLSWAPDEDDGAGDRARPVAQQRLRRRRSAGTSTTGRALRRGRREHVHARAGRARSVHVSADLGPARRLAARVRRARLRRDLPAPRRPGAGRVHRRVRREGAAPAGGRRRAAGMRLDPDRATCGGRTPSSTAWTSRRYLDGDGDGCGDFRGLSQRIDHLAELGVTCIWLMPFYPTPDRDDGYDITDFYGVDPRLGTLGDFVEFVRTAHDRGMRVIADLVVNHTSDQHPWFQSARSSRDSPYRDWYVWRDEPPPDGPQGVVVPRRGDEHLGVRRGGRPVLPAPLLQAPAGPQRGQPRRCATRSPRSWASGSSWAVRLPGRRRAVPAGDRRRRVDGAELPDPHDYLARPAVVPRPPQRRGGPARRGEPARTRTAGAFFGERRTRRRADDVLRLHRHAAAVPVAGPRRRRPAGRGAARAGPRSRRTASGRRSCATTTS